MRSDTEMTPNNEEQEYFLDDKDFIAKFLLDPNIEGEADFSHLDKNLAITNLIHSNRLGINEVEQARFILKGLHVLNNTLHYHVVEKINYYRNEKGELSYKTIKVLESKYPKSFHGLKSQFLSFVNTAAARGGHRINAANTRITVNDSNIVEKTDVPKQKIWGNNKTDFSRY